MHTSTCTHACIHTHTHPSRTRARIYTHTHTRIYIYIYIYIQTHIHIEVFYIHMRRACISYISLILLLTKAFPHCTATWGPKPGSGTPGPLSASHLGQRSETVGDVREPQLTWHRLV